jgi:hypothetical protein
LGEDDCIPSCNEVSYKITATTTAKFPGTGTGIETGTDADFTRAARNLLSNLTKNLNHRYKKYTFMTKYFDYFYELFFFSENRDNLVMVNVFFPENSILKYKRDELYAFEDIICKFY